MVGAGDGRGLALDLDVVDGRAVVDPDRVGRLGGRRRIVGGGSSLIRVLSAAVRGLQSGYLRYYAALLLVGLTSLSLYFLVSA